MLKSSIPRPYLRTGDTFFFSSSADIYLNSFIVAEYDAMAEILRRNDKDATFILSGNKIYELFQVDKSHSSWFVGNSVISNGSLLYCVEINPLFIVLPFVSSRSFLVSKNRYVPTGLYVFRWKILCCSVCHDCLSPTRSSDHQPHVLSLFPAFQVLSSLCRHSCLSLCPVVAR